MATLEIKFKSKAEKTCVLPTVSRALAKELFTLMLKILQIMNLETIKNCLLTGPFNKIDGYTN